MDENKITSRYDSDSDILYLWIGEGDIRDTVEVGEDLFMHGGGGGEGDFYVGQVCRSIRAYKGLNKSNIHKKLYGLYKWHKLKD